VYRPAETLADDAADVAAFLVGDEIGRKARSAGKVHDLDIVAGVVEQFARFGLLMCKVRRDQRVVGGVQPPQQIVVRPVGNQGRLVASRQHPKVSATLRTTIIDPRRLECSLVDRQRNLDVVVSFPEPVGALAGQGIECRRS
jgi:hypothetical protein